MKTSFMTAQIIHARYYEVDTYEGIVIIPTDVCGMSIETEKELAEYCSGEICNPEEPIIWQEGYLSRLSANGYMDQTEWIAGDTEFECVESLIETYDIDNVEDIGSVQEIIESAKKDCANSMSECIIDEMQTYGEYAEPGYSGNPITGNWNDITEWNAETRKSKTVCDIPSRLGSVLECLGFTLEWNDEWTACEDCYNIFRISGDSYSWQQYGTTQEGMCVCGDCLKDDPTDYLESLEDDPRAALTLDIDPTEYGYILIEDNFENGFHPGQTDDPAKILAELQEKNIERILFVVDEVSQFYIVFSVHRYVDIKEWYNPQ